MLKRSFKKYISVFLVVLFTLSMMPSVLYAAGEEGTNVAVNTNTGTEYSSLQEAFNDAGKGDTIKLLADVTEHFTVGKEAALNLDGNKLTVDVNEGVSVTSGSSLTITNGSIDSAYTDILNANGGTITLGASLSVTASRGADIYAHNNGTVIIDGAVVYGGEGNVTAFAEAGGKIIMNSGMLESATMALSVNGTGSAEISGGEVKGGGTVIRAGSANYAPDNGLITVKGGTVSTTSTTLCTAWARFGGKIVVEGGEVIGNGRGGLVSTSNSTVEVTDGTVTDATGYAVLAHEGNATANISGGTINGALGSGSTNAGTGNTVTVSGGVIKGQVYVQNASTFNINGGIYQTNKGNGDSFTRKDNKLLVQIESGEYAGMYQLQVDKTDLKTEIDTATEEKDSTSVSEDGKDLAPGTVYVTPEDAQNLQDAIEAAQAVYNNPVATQSEADTAKETLNTARQAFDAAKKTAAAVDKTALKAAIDAATEDKDSTEVSEDGKGLEPGTKYVTSEESQKLQDAIDAAQAVFDKADATQNETDAATAALDTAKQTFDGSKKEAAVDKTALKTAIDTATEDKDSTKVSKDGKDLEPGTKYVTPEDSQKLQDAINAAQAIYDKADATQHETDAATAALDTAKKAFDDAKKEAEKATVYKITFDLNGGTLDGQTGAVTVEYEMGKIIRLPKPTREGYTFDYWEGSHYEADQEYVVTEDHTFTAQWKKNSSSGSGSNNSSSSKSGSSSGSSSGKTAASAKTGDTDTMVLWIGLLLASLLIMTGLLVDRRREQDS